ncbi:hypothetical protein B0H19DRAFT_269187 [Mycena capillaripes]|nr:hypothetical protein B0H19DRAFT_269187 [Mycena capillaripes]
MVRQRHCCVHAHCSHCTYTCRYPSSLLPLLLPLVGKYISNSPLWPPSRTQMRYNPFSIARLVLLCALPSKQLAPLTKTFWVIALQVHLNLLVLVTAAWNVNVTQASGQPVPAAELCLIFTSLAFLIFISLGSILWCLKITSPFIVSLKFECGWSVVLLIFGFAATIGASVHVLLPGSAAVISASHGLLLAVGWMTVMITFIYLAGLIVVVMLHKPTFPEIWKAPASSVDWFVHRQLDANSMGNDSWTRYLDDIESSAMRKQRFGAFDCEAHFNADPEKQNIHPKPNPEKAPWAQNIRRGVDEPFAFRSESDAASESPSITPSKLNAALPPLPLRVEPKAKPAGSRFIERFRESQITVRSSQQGGPSTPFPSGVDDHNKPIPLPRWSEWVRADAD